MSPKRGAVLLVAGLATACHTAVAAPAPVPTTSPSTPAPHIAPVVRIPFPADDGTLTPYTFDSGYALVTLVYDTLMWRDAGGRPQPWLAESVLMSTDQTSVAIHLREGARWHDGSPVTSADVAFTFGYVAEHPNPRFTAEVLDVAAVTTPDPATVAITLRRPSPGFMDQTLDDLPILPAHIWQRLKPGQQAPDGLAVGSGPYRLTEHIPGKSYRFDASPGYFRGPPLIQTIVMPIISDAEATLAAFEAQKVDMVPESLPAADRTRLEALGDRVVSGQLYLGSVLMLNTRRPPFDRREVREAVSQALDTSKIAQLLGNDVAPGRYYLHPDSPWTPDHAGHLLDHAAAARTLGGLGLGPIDVMAPENDPVKLEGARQVAIDLRSAGLPSQAKPVAPAALSKAVGEDGSSATFTAAIWNSYPLASYDPNFLARVFSSDPSRAMFNYAGYHSAVFDAAAARVETTVDRGLRAKAVADELGVLAADAPVVPLYYPVGSFAYRPSVFDGWVFVKGSGILDKRSFDAHPLPPVESSAPQTQSNPSEFPAGAIALGAGALLVIAAIGATVDGLRRRPRRR